MEAEILAVELKVTTHDNVVSNALVRDCSAKNGVTKATRAKESEGSA